MTVLKIKRRNKWLAIFFVGITAGWAALLVFAIWAAINHVNWLPVIK